MNLKPDRLDFGVWRGATFHALLTLYVDDGVTPRDLTNYTADLTIRDAPGSVATPLLQMTTSNGGITLGGLAGTIDLKISAADTAGITWNQGVYDLLITAPNGGDTDVLTWGNFKVSGV